MTDNTSEKKVADAVALLAEWFATEEDIKAVGFEAAMIKNNRCSFAESDADRCRLTMQSWACAVGELGVEGTAYINIHQHLDPVKHQASITDLHSTIKMNYKPMEQDVTVALDALWKQRKGDAKKADPFQVTFREQKETTFTFKPNGTTGFEEEELSYRGVVFPTLGCAPHFLHTLRFRKEVSEAEAVESASIYLSKPLTKEYYEARQAYLAGNVPWDKTEHKIRGDLLEGCDVVSDFIVVTEATHALGIVLKVEWDDDAEVAPEM
ncbi:Hypothetical protein POVN_LOCUS690 [uncultured virus]|nr:Hypothetical protein POVN_LOCUS690 [uncultured virus]